MITINPRSSIRSIARECHVSHTIVDRILRKHKYQPFKIQCHQELRYGDEERRQTFCEIMQQKANQDEHFLSSICFTDESTFTLNNEPNTQNTRYWSIENPRQVVATRTQYPQKINILAGIYQNRIIGPFLINGNLDAAEYLNLLQNDIGPAIDDVAGEDDEIWYQHDGCPAHFSAAVTRYLNDCFPNHWIGRNGPIEWPPRSPDLAPCDYFLWGHLKSQIYKTRHDNIASLWNAIQEQCGLVRADQLRAVTNSFYNRLGYCLAQNGGLFEHLL